MKRYRGLFRVRYRRVKGNFSRYRIDRIHTEVPQGIGNSLVFPEFAFSAYCLPRCRFDGPAVTRQVGVGLAQNIYFTCFLFCTLRIGIVFLLFSFFLSPNHLKWKAVLCVFFPCRVSILGWNKSVVSPMCIRNSKEKMIWNYHKSVSPVSAFVRMACMACMP